MYESYDQPPATIIYPNQRRIDWKTLGAYALAALGVGFGIACLLLLVGYKNTVSTQFGQMSHAVQREQSARASEDKSLSGKIAATDNAVSDFAQFDMLCSQALTGPNGPAQFDFPCRQH